MKIVIIKNKNMNLFIAPEILETFPQDIKVFFYQSGCEGTKINLTGDFEKQGLQSIRIGEKNIYFSAEDAVHLEEGKILLQAPKLDHEGKPSPTKYLFVSPKVQGRCGCASSFSFEKKLIDSNKLKQLKKAF